MAVESRFVVIRHGVEAKTFMDKKSADEYDKMLDMADNLAEVFAHSSLTLPENLSEELSIYLAQNRDDVLVALLAKKPPKPAVNKAPKLVEVNDNLVASSAENKTQELVDNTAVKTGENVKAAKVKTAKATKAKKAKTTKEKTDEDISAAS